MKGTIIQYISHDGYQAVLTDVGVIYERHIEHSSDGGYLKKKTWRKWREKIFDMDRRV
jgi:hypothetical protein